MRRTPVIAAVTLIGAVLFLQNGGRFLNTITQVGSSSDEVFGAAFAERRGNFVAEGNGVVVRVLSDDREGSRHQRFIVELASGQTLLIAHNIDIAPRVEGLQQGDTVSFKGEYEWNDKGGVIHWTHHDPAENHEPGWIRHGGRTYQ